MSRVMFTIILGTILVLSQTVMASNPFEYCTEKYELTQRITKGMMPVPR